MGVKLLIRTHPPKGVAGPAHYEQLKRLVDELCASQLPGRSEAWAVTCQLLKQGHGLLGAPGGGPGPGGGLKDLWTVSFRDAAELIYLVSRPDCKVLECEGAMMRLLEKKLEYGKTMTVRLEGHTYMKGDFLIRICTATQNIHSSQALLGYCLDLEYLPVTCLAAAEGMLGEFVELVRGLVGLVGGGLEGTGLTRPGGGGTTVGLELVKPSYDKYGLSSMSYSRCHAAVSYSDLVFSLLNSSAAATAAATVTAAGAQQQPAPTAPQQQQTQAQQQPQPQLQQQQLPQQQPPQQTPPQQPQAQIQQVQLQQQLLHQQAQYHQQAVAQQQHHHHQQQQQQTYAR